MIFIIIVFLVFSSSVIGGTADLSIELEFNTIDGVVWEQQGEFTARITNNGPDVAAENAPIPLPISLLSGIIRDNGSFTPEIQFTAGANNNNQECFFVLIIGDPPPGGGPSYAYDIDVPSIQVGQTIECFGIFSTHFNSGTREVNWNIRNTFDDDPVSANNTQTVVFGIAPRSVPVNSLSAMISLIFLFLMVGLYSHRKS